MVKEIVHYSDGTKKPNIHTIPNYQRPFYVTKVGHQNHKDRKEWEDLTKLQPYYSSESELIWNIGRAIGEPGFRGTKRKILNNQFIYGADILSTAIIKRGYQDKYGGKIQPSPYTVAVFDVETSMFDKDGTIIMGTLSFGNKAITAVREDFVEGYSNVVERLKELKKQYVDQYIENRNIDWEIVIVKNATEVIKKCFARAHEWKPDYVAIWNITFDMGKILDQLMRDGIDPKDIFSDPAVPDKFRYFNFKLDNPIKVTATGKKTPKKPPQMWHTVYAPASFYVVDAMCAYRQIRQGAGEEQSYALDAILAKEFKDKPIRKLKFAAAEGFVKGELHKFMQSQHPLEYIVYNLFDCITVELLDEKTKDLAIAMPMFSGCSDFENFNSQPRRSVDNLHWFCLSRGRVIGSTADEMVHEFDKLTVDGDGWIVTLPAHTVADNGLYVIKGMPNHRTNIRVYVGDLDVAASYPNGGAVLNMSRETTKKEIHRIEGVSEIMMRMQGINLSGGHVNAVEFCTGIYGMPEHDQMLHSFERSLAEEAVAA